MKKLLVVGVIVLFLGVAIAPSINADVKQITMPTSSGNTLYVGGNGTGNYSKIQDAIDDASNGDTVYVYDNSSPYYENLIVDKSISLIGENRETTVIYPWYWYYVVNISTNQVNISGFNIKSDDEGTYGIFLDSCNNNISGNIISDNYCGIFASNSSNGNIIMGNNIISSGVLGIKFEPSSCNNIIIGNDFQDNLHDITLRGTNNTIKDNTFSDTRCCVCIRLWNSTCNNISDNTINSAKGAGIALGGSDNNIILGNTISNCGWGLPWGSIELGSSSNNTISYNTISKNKYGYGIDLHYFSNNNSIYHNNIVNNEENAYDEYNNTWDNGYPSGGNYWDDYNGTDDDGDGIGDTPYPIPGGDNEDRYPLMEPIGNDSIPPITTISLDPPAPNGDNGWYVSNVTVTLKATDDGFGVKAIYYRIPGEEWINQTGDVLTFILDYNCLEDGLIEFYSVDYFGNQEEIKSVSIDMDQLPPEVKVEVETFKEGGKWYVIFNIIGEDTCSGGDRVEMFINDGEHEIIVGAGPTYEFVVEWSKAFKSVTFWFYCYDVAGNVASVSVNGSDINSRSYSQSYSTLFLRWLDMFPLLNQLIIRIMERWSI